VVIEKRKGYLLLTWGSLALLALVTLFAWPLTLELSEGIAMTVLFSPCWISLGVAAWFARRSSNRVIRIEKTYLVVEDFKPSKLPWSEILSFSVIHKNVSQIGDFAWLIVHFKDNTKYLKRKWYTKIDEALFGEGVAVCTLNHYKGTEAEILEKLNKALRNNKS